MVERTGRIHDEKHDVRCKKCNAVLFKTRSMNGKLRTNFAHDIEIKCRKCKLVNRI